MSADNYYLIRKHPNGGYAAVQGFASEQIVHGYTPEASPADRSFPTVLEALYWACDQYSEYGVECHEECGPEWVNH